MTRVNDSTTCPHKIYLAPDLIKVSPDATSDAIMSARDHCYEMKLAMIVRFDYESMDKNSRLTLEQGLTPFTHKFLHIPHRVEYWDALGKCHVLKDCLRYEVKDVNDE